MRLLRKRVEDKDILWLLNEVVRSFCANCLLDSRFRGNDKCKGIPLGNLTSQVFANIYMNELDQFVKHKLRVQYYLRYADDFVILSNDKKYLEELILLIQKFLVENLKLQLHPNKIILRKLNWGIDFLGYIILLRYILPRTKTKRRMFRKVHEKIRTENFNQSLQSYLGYLSHSNSFEVVQQLKNMVYYIDSRLDRE